MLRVFLGAKQGNGAIRALTLLVEGARSAAATRSGGSNSRKCGSPTFAHACQRRRELRLAGHAEVVRRSLGGGGPQIPPFISTVGRRPVLEKWRRCGGSIESISQALRLM